MIEMAATFGFYQYFNDTGQTGTPHSVMNAL